MKCPSCMHEETRVVDSRYAEGEFAIRRRRECSKCGYRFTTFERVEIGNLTVVKKDGRREPYNRSKLERGIERAAEKRPIPPEAIKELIGKVETELRGMSTSEVSSRQIGNVVMKNLKKLDKVTYIRYASVYKEFEDLDSLEEELRKLLRRKKTTSEGN
ncbi:transcriptional regulator NrdR [Candidatus Wirthbacteria bacterium CG2_30_54_11]|uniref:Transcriptional repressor NrdR n=1 Tax=Candidatus Wirthbacteria bacterium CG2_30_54_11 TaxID=1817892 RepID=A0A1J5J428_9BACT|nr:MAG: transcriptional regulator NrdR [Candidatus Wirthbacteria bacterium CG2_30_54_11]